MKTNWNLHAHIEKNNAYGKEVGFAKEDFEKHKHNFVHLKFSFNDLSFFKAGYTTKNDILKVLKNILNEFTEQIENGFNYTEKRRRNGKQYARTLQINNFKIAAHLDKMDHPHLHFLFNKKQAKNLGNRYIQLRKLLANISKKYNLENISFENENYVSRNKYLKIKLENFFWQIIRNSESNPDFNIQNEIKKRFGNIENFENLLFNYIENYKNYSFINKLIKKINNLADEKLFNFIYEEQYFEILELIKQKDLDKLKNFSNSKLLREYIRYCYDFNYSKSYINFDHLNISKDVDFVNTLIKTIDFKTTKTNNSNNKNKYNHIFKTLNAIVNYAINVSKNEKELLDNLNVNDSVKVKWHTKNSVKLGFTFIVNNNKYVYTFNKCKYKNISNVRKILKENNFNYVSALLTDGNIGNINNNINIEQLQKYYDLLINLEKEEPIKAADYSLLFNNACINNFNDITQNKKITKQVYFKKIKELYAKRQHEMQKNFAYRKQNFSYKNIKNYIDNEKELKTEIFNYLFADKNKYKTKRR